ncbi:MAG: prenyltransferase [Spartobacteria bacterium]|nr:prenyltransferase [Spartobacteria bacterium]
MKVTDIPMVLRAFAAPASVVPVVYGAVLAATFERSTLSLLWLCVTLAAMCCLHFSANVINDIKDYQNGLDVLPTPTSGGIVRGTLSIRTAWMIAGATGMIGAGLGLLIAWHAGGLIILYGVIGVAGMFFYSVGPFALKYAALGDAAVFLCFGVLGTLGSWTVQTGAFSWRPVLWSLPVAMYIVGILHANNWRDREHDRACHIKTTAILLGSRGSALYFYACMGLPPVLVTVYCVLPHVMSVPFPPFPPTALIVWLIAPLIFKMIHRARQYQKNPSLYPIDDLDGLVAQTSLIFGVLAVIGLLLS